MSLSRRQDDLHGLSQAVASQVNLRAEAAARSPQRLCLGTTAFRTSGMLMGANYSGIQEQNAQVGILQLLHDGLEHAILAPAIEALKDAVPVAEALGQVTPGSAGLGQPQDGVDEQAIVLGRPTGVAFLARQEFLDGVPLSVRNLMASQHTEGPEKESRGRHGGGRPSIVGLARPRAFTAVALTASNLGGWENSNGRTEAENRLAGRPPFATSVAFPP